MFATACEAISGLISPADWPSSTIFASRSSQPFSAFHPCAESEVAIIGIHRKVQERASSWKTSRVDIVVYMQFEFVDRI